MNTPRIEQLKTFIKEEPNDPFNRYALAMEYFNSDEQKAISLLKELLEKFPAYLPSYYKYAHLLWERQDLETAEKVFEAGIELAQDQQDLKALKELKSAFQNFIFEKD